jgi:hypothetical protein
MSDDKLPAPSEDHHPVVKGLLAVWGEIKDFPAAAKAIAKLIGRGADAGSAHLDILQAKGEAGATAIRDEAKAKSAITAALTQAAAQRALTDPDLADRALALWADERITKQVNREAVATVAIEDLRENPPPPDQEPPTDDWMNVFAGYAERASSETLREHWGRILAGEIRKPGSFTFQTLQLMSVLDKHLAEIIEETCPAIINKTFIPPGPPFNLGDRYTDLLELDSLGFLQVADGTQHCDFDPEGVIALRFNHFVLILRGEPGARLPLPAIFLTRAGRELMSVISYSAISYKDDRDLVEEIATQYQTTYYTGDKKIGLAAVDLFEVVDESHEGYRANRVITLWRNSEMPSAATGAQLRVRIRADGYKVAGQE